MDNKGRGPKTYPQRKRKCVRCGEKEAYKTGAPCPLCAREILENEVIDRALQKANWPIEKVIS